MMMRRSFTSVSRIAVLVIVVCLGCDRRNVQEMKVERLKQNIVVGLSRGEVQANLAAEGVGHSWDPKERTVLVMVRDVGGGAFVSKSIQGIIAIGPNDRVSSLQWREVYTGP